MLMKKFLCVLVVTIFTIEMCSCTQRKDTQKDIVIENETNLEENQAENNANLKDESGINAKFDGNNQFQLALESIGMDKNNVKNIQDLDDWELGKRFSFVYDGFGYIVYELDNGEIESINTEYKRAKIYERGYKPLNYKDFEPNIDVLRSLEEDLPSRLSKYISGETSIKSKLGSMMYSRIYNYYSISGEVNAKNSANKKDFTFTVDYIVDGYSYECVYVSVDGNVVYGSDKTPEIKKEELVQDESVSDEGIILSYGKEGDYGQYDSFDGEPYLRYYVPAGGYTVKCNIGGGFYVETAELHKEDGWDTAETIQQITMSSGDEEDIVIEEGQCISLYNKTEIELFMK